MGLMAFLTLRAAWTRKLSLVEAPGGEMPERVPSS
jgi:hypothetical protein